jgi:hypothetical protein
MTNSYPPDTPEKQKALGAFFGGIGAPARAAERVSGIVKGIKEFNSNIKTLGVVGVCALTSAVPNSRS